MVVIVYDLSSLIHVVAVNSFVLEISVRIWLQTDRQRDGRTDGRTSSSLKAPPPLYKAGAEQ